LTSKAQVIIHPAFRSQCVYSPVVVHNTRSLLGWQVPIMASPIAAMTLAAEPNHSPGAHSRASQSGSLEVCLRRHFASISTLQDCFCAMLWADSGDGTTQKIRRAPVPCTQPGNDCTVSCHRAVEECACSGKQDR